MTFNHPNVGQTHPYMVWAMVGPGILARQVILDADFMDSAWVIKAERGGNERKKKGSFGHFCTFDHWIHVVFGVAGPLAFARAL